MEETRIDDALASIDAAIERGDLFVAYDLAAKAMSAYPQLLVFQHRAVLALARMNAPRALRLYEDCGLMTSFTGIRLLDIDIASLGARLLKDRALASPGLQRGPLSTRGCRSISGHIPGYW